MVSIGGFGFAVSVKRDCPHVDMVGVKPVTSEEEAKRILESACSVCGNEGENWVGVNDHHVSCSRYVNSHNLKRWEKSCGLSGEPVAEGGGDADVPECGHAVSVSFMDLSVWCHVCESYIEDRRVTEGILVPLRKAKFGEEESSDAKTRKISASEGKIEEEQVEIEEGAGDEQPSPENEEPELMKTRDLDGLVRALSDPDFRPRIACLCGAGTSTSCGIPDFRSEDGIYHRLSSMGVDPKRLGSPEDVFSIDFFREDPEPFWAVARSLFFTGGSGGEEEEEEDDGVKDSEPFPSDTHLFLSLLAQKGYLKRCVTMNIDGLEARAGVPSDVLIQAHGGLEGATCVNCGTETDLDAAADECRRSKVAPRCAVCGGPIKPGIVFFGEGLPRKFNQSFDQEFVTPARRYRSYEEEDDESAYNQDVDPSSLLHPHSEEEKRQRTLRKRPPLAVRPFDLFLVLGSSLTVAPASMLPEIAAATHTHRVLINREIAGDFSSENDTLLLGDCDDTIRELVRKLGWQREMDSLKAHIQNRHHGPWLGGLGSPEKQ